MTKKYRVEVTEPAANDILSARDYIAAGNPAAADRWFSDIEQLISRLETLPFAFEVIPEFEDIGVEYRHKLFGKYRIIYHVDEDRIIVMRVIHGAQLLDASILHSWTTGRTQKRDKS